MNMALGEWYADRELLLTGVTSDLGRALLEKILRSFPKTKVHAIVRSRDTFTKDDRIKNILLSPRFERLRQQDPNALTRVKALEGNLLYEGLGTTETGRALLQNVSVVLHAGGPHEKLLEFCQGLPRLEVVAAFTSIFQEETGNRISESLGTEWMLDGPVALVRVPLVGSALSEPMPGFVDILKGSTALMVGAGLALGNAEFQAEIIPIDLAVNTLIAVAWERATAARNVRGTVLYNATSIGCTWSELIKKSQRGNQKFTYPTFGLRGMTSIATVYWILVTLFEWLPSAFCDTILGLVGAKRRLLDEHRKVRNALRSLESVSSRPWSVERNRVSKLQQHLTPFDQDAFPVLAEIDVESYVLCTAAAAKKYCVDEANITVVKIFRLLFLLLIAAVLLYAFFAYRHHVSAKHHQL